MGNLVNIALGAVIIAGVYFLFRRFGKYRKPEHINVIDPQSQELYEQQKRGDEKKTLSLQEKIELSWQFLTNITKQVLLKFSKTDQKNVNKIGQDLANIGMKYEHNVDMEVRIIQQVSKARTVTQSKEKDNSIAR
jgi:hypothetical protein